MIGQAPPPLRRDAAANRRRLISAAVEVFNDEGIDAGVEAIAHRAGVGVGTLYRRFPTKEALIAFLVDQLLEDLTRAAMDAEDVPDGRGLEQFLASTAEQLASHRGCLQRLWNQTATDEAGVAGLRRRIDHLVEQARDAGAVRPDVTRADVTSVIWALQGVITNAGDDPQAVAARFLSMTWSGLVPDPRVGSTASRG